MDILLFTSRIALLLMVIIFGKATTPAFADTGANKKQLAIVSPGTRPIGKVPYIKPYVKLTSGRFLKRGDEGYVIVTKQTPQNFPFPLPTGGIVVANNEVVTCNGQAYYLRYQARNDLSSTVNWYVATLKQAGWVFPAKGPEQDAKGFVYLTVRRQGSSGSIMFCPGAQGGNNTGIVFNITMR